MSTYHRRGHYRRGKDGRSHWVSGHDVTRSSGSKNYYRSSQTAKNSYITLQQQIRLWLSELSIVAYPESPRRPNSTCPVCGAAVWFFRNRWGGCAYFDGIGQPWPLHPCLDLAKNAENFDTRQRGPSESSGTFGPKWGGIDVRESGRNFENSSTPENNFHSRVQRPSDRNLVDNIRGRRSPWDATSVQSASDDRQLGCCLIFAIIMIISIIVTIVDTLN